MAYLGTSSELSDIQNLLWGSSVEDDVFRRWAQGFHFSKEEPTALEQTEGGPCAVIAPVQAFILKILVSEPAGNNWREADAEQCNELLVKAICDILNQASKYNGERYRLVHLSDSTHSSSSSLVHTSIENTGNQEQVAEYFHAHLRLVLLETREEVEAFYQQRIEMLHDTFGVLLFLYSVMCTKGSEAIRSEMDDPSEPFIDETYGYGSQGLINLMMTGRAVGHVWDHEQDVDGLKLRGIDRQSDIGFLTLLEHLRYCRVGSFLKNPKNPVWVLGSETHLTVLFSFDKQLVRPETPGETARRIFKSFNPEGNDFIATSRIQDVLQALDLFSEPEYVDIMSKKLDPENLGIVLLNAFMDEFFPDEKSSLPDSFVLFHYNGLAKSCPDGKVMYQEGQAVLLECDLDCVMDSDPMLTCLQTKWPNIEVQWIREITPSLN
ncbi:ubiquitin carboxyl-terminal hydrolase MINDY-3 homolog [Anabrus simplex]|uniref:ubiquitin carboxyl-terminal hydrolase MINDY-3 homolog n=1 Tax=Anabrus simplex TaxID=316456 RepID=UPI0035A2E48E